MKNYKDINGIVTIISSGVIRKVTPVSYEPYKGDWVRVARVLVRQAS